MSSRVSVPSARHGFEFFPVEKIGGRATVAEEEPVAAFRADGRAFFEEGAEGGDAGAGPDHDHGGVWPGRGPEVFVGMNKDGDGLLRTGTVGEESGTDSFSLASQDS